MPCVSNRLKVIDDYQLAKTGGKSILAAGWHKRLKIVWSGAEAYPRFESRGDNIHGDRGARAYSGGLGALPQWGPGA
jgi:hypothetical protein